MRFPVALSGAAMAMRKLWDKLHKMTDEELIKFRKDVRRLAENPFQRQLDEARAEFKWRKEVQVPPSPRAG